MFQSTRPRGARLTVWFDKHGQTFVSIHAPARGATSSSLPRTGLCWEFQSTRPRGARLQQAGTGFDDVQRFNPRAREGRDAIAPRDDISLSTCFNPRAREGRDSIRCLAMRHQPGFQSTRPRGARLVEIQSIKKPKDSFNPRAREGRDRQHFHMMKSPGQFQSTRPRGARLKK